jgi:hypothetical protein
MSRIFSEERRSDAEMGGGGGRSDPFCEIMNLKRQCAQRTGAKRGQNPPIRYLLYLLYSGYFKDIIYCEQWKNFATTPQHFMKTNFA